MHPLHGDDEDEGPVVFGAVGYRMTRHLRVEGEISRRSATRSFVTTDVFCMAARPAFTAAPTDRNWGSRRPTGRRVPT